MTQQSSPLIHVTSKYPFYRSLSLRTSAVADDFTGAVPLVAVPLAELQSLYSFKLIRDKCLHTLNLFICRSLFVCVTNSFVSRSLVMETIFIEYKFLATLIDE